MYIEKPITLRNTKHENKHLHMRKTNQFIIKKIIKINSNTFYMKSNPCERTSEVNRLRKMKFLAVMLNCLLLNVLNFHVEKE